MQVCHQEVARFVPQCALLVVWEDEGEPIRDYRQQAWRSAPYG